MANVTGENIHIFEQFILDYELEHIFMLTVILNN